MTSRRRNVLIVSLALLAAGVGLRIAWMEGLKYRFQPRKWGVVEAAGFYRSGQIHERIVEDVLREHEIDLIVDLASDDPQGDPYEAAERLAAERLGIRRIEYGLKPRGQGDPRIYVDALRAVIRARREGQRVLVHCNAGRERTGALVGMYRMLVDGWSGESAYEEYLQYRKEPPERPVLRRYLRKKLPRIATALAESGDIEAPPSELPRFGPADVAASP